ncbi:adenylate/guanylate cyclase domain-containing protein [Candidatus Nitrosotenuis aquarius]|uniref:adenylate/guanylate cyclase domain-containing protein n=1 Tax=Candidatus Nitrosotenuis aquarius TaxID=1846278 RepID=UPI000C1F67BD|nr:adenylate/guanylate cyclase domain-containing protein [Candidatus Nitrosotenuis aquarius]
MRKPIPVTLDKKLVSLVMAVSLIGIGVTIFFSFHYATIILGERATNQLIGEAAIRGSAIEGTMKSKIQEMQVITTNPMIKLLVSELNQIEDAQILAGTIAQKRMDFLIEVQAFEASIGGLDDLENVEIVGIDGERLFALINTKNKKDYLSDPIFVRGAKEPFTQIILGADGKRKIVTAAPIFEKPKDQSPSGVAIITANTNQIDSVLLNRKGLGQTGEAYLVSQYGYMISESRFIPNAPFVQKVDTEPLKHCLADGQIYFGIHNDYRGMPVLGASNCMKSLGMSMIVEIDEVEVFEPVADLRDKIIVLGAIITVVVGVAAYFLSKLISKPIIKLKNAANQVANGDFNVRTNIKTDDEIGQLSRSFDQMAEQIQDSLLKIKEREDIIKQQKDILLQFSQYSSNYCVCFVDIVGSTKLTSKLSDMETSKFYSIFLNSAATAITQNHGVVVKNIGDALLYYFPKTDSEEQTPFEEMLHCCMKLIEARTTINRALGAENLPEVSYRISAMFGPVRVAIVATSAIDDIFGSTVNTCSKINSLAKPNTLVIGESLYQKVKDIKGYKFEKIANYTIDAENKFAVYLVSQ